jgi:hypothetical protein
LVTPPSLLGFSQYLCTIFRKRRRKDYLILGIFFSDIGRGGKSLIDFIIANLQIYYLD